MHEDVGEETGSSDAEITARLKELETEVVMLREILDKMRSGFPAGGQAQEPRDNLALRWWGGRWT